MFADDEELLPTVVAAILLLVVLLLDEVVATELDARGVAAVVTLLFVTEALDDEVVFGAAVVETWVELPKSRSFLISV